VPQLGLQVLPFFLTLGINEVTAYAERVLCYNQEEAESKKPDIQV
jgi:hypothetical protein